MLKGITFARKGYQRFTQIAGISNDLSLKVVISSLRMQLQAALPLEVTAIIMESCQLCHSQAAVLLCCCREAGIKVCSSCASPHFQEDSKHYPLAYSFDLAKCQICENAHSAYICMCSIPVKMYCEVCLNAHICSGTAPRHDTYPAAAKDFIDCKRSYSDFLDRQHLVNSVETLLLGNLVKMRLCKSTVDMLAGDLVTLVEKWREETQDFLEKEERKLLFAIQNAFRSLLTIRVKWKFSVKNKLERILSDCVFTKQASPNPADFCLFSWELRPEILLIPLSTTLQIAHSSHLLSPVHHLYYVVPWSCKVVTYAVPSIVPIEIHLAMKGKFKSFSSWCEFAPEKLCVTGGWKRIQSKEQYSKEAYFLDLASNVAIPALNMNTERCRHALVSVNGGIYAIGGFNSAAVRSIERLASETEDWQEIAELHEGKDCVSAAIWKGKIYLTGYGCRKIEVFDPVLVRFYTFSVKYESHFASFLGPKYVSLLGVCGNELILLLEQEVLRVNLTSGLSTGFPLATCLTKSWFSQSSAVLHHKDWFFSTLDQELWLLSNNSLEYLARVVA